MGTRNLTIVISNGKTKVAQYGQWDGYPDGQGETALNFLTNTNLELFKAKLKKVRFITTKDKKERKEFLSSIGSDNGWLNMEQSAKYNEKYPLDSRDWAAKILSAIMESEADKITLNNSESFAADSLFCEWAYVIDLDKNVFEVYEGFNTQPLTENDRFFHLQKKIKKGEDKYYPIRLAKSYDLSNLPTVNKFINDFKTVEEEQD